MTEASKARKWEARTKDPRKHNRRWSMAHMSNPIPSVVTSGVSCRMGVGGRRGRKRQPARLRFWRARARDEIAKVEKFVARLLDPGAGLLWAQTVPLAKSGQRGRR